MKNKEKGITLIALIITIIVMLILVAVTISVALNGGLFNNARDASDKTKRAVSKEELISAMVGAYDNTGSFKIDNVELPAGAMWCGEEDEIYNPENEVEPTGEGDWVITEIGNKFYVTSDGTVLDEKQESNPTGNQAYYLDSEILEMEFYIIGNNIYFDLGEGDGWQYNEIKANTGMDATLGRGRAETVNAQLGEDTVSAETPRYTGFGSLELLLINNEWYIYMDNVEKFELVNIDTSFLDAATQFSG